MNITKYLHYPTDAWRWTPAVLEDIPAMNELTKRDFESEADHTFRIDPARHTLELALAITRQTYAPASEFVFVARRPADRSGPGAVIAYNWIMRGQYMTYSPDEMAAARFIHIDQTLSARQRIAITVQSLLQWETWAKLAGIPIVCSTSVRQDYNTFMRIHEALGYRIQGACAYRRVIK